ncbi:Serrate RNA effector molecule [Rhynchospora pubera]|uniref:Serrate RNA effector molecule n=1 Tax=Rhynchospora pubera TaxID=906938 RepID=A0AAV8FH04_9POAL|nr:Serrate RNA effector molecule [Rhynchospora pubera]
MAEVIDMSAGNLDRRRSPSGGDESPSNPLPPPPPGPPPRKRDREEPNPNPRSSPPSFQPPAPAPSRPDRFFRDRERDRDRDGERDRDRDRDRDYHRRRSPSHSPSPPPYSHRERRRSPPLRRPSPNYSPPPYYNNKRTRRDDGGFDRRRGSPREDRRFGYEFGGGRGGFGDDRPHGRFNRHSDWSDAGFGGYGDAPISTQREGLMTYKQFIQVLEDDILPAEAERRYQEYRNEYITTQKRAYFDLHKDEEWLKEKYHPTNLVSVIEKRNEQAKSLAKEFLSDLQNGTLDIGPEKIPSKPVEESDANSDESDSGGNRRRRTKAKDKDLSTAPRAHPVSSEPRRIQLDIDHAQSLARKLDSEKRIEGNILAHLDKSEGGPMGPIIIIRGPSTVKGLEGIELLDTLLTYLWRVHGVDYYGMKESHEAKDLRHIRGEAKAGSDESASDWEKRLDSHWEERINGLDPLMMLSAKDKIEAVSGEVLDPLVRKIRDEKYGWKYGCGAKGCTKLFHAPEFVHKHLKLKHPELVVELTAKVREEIYFQNYMNDPNAPGGAPVMQQPAQQDRVRRKPPLANRLRDDRGGPRREEDRGNKRRPEGSPTREGDEAAEAKNGDEPMFDAFGARGPRGGAAPFLAEFPPPPILMPVPGAGPLGPFVPAPPEVAMRMMREQGGAPPFDSSNGGPPAIGGGGLGSRKAGMLGVPPVIGGSAPLIAMPPTFQHDPRRIRSYRDLDAPEDEVTVLDYRSL